MKVTLRQRNQGGKTSLYLDYYGNGKRKREHLKLYLEPNPKTKQQRDENKRLLELAEAIRAKRLIEIQNGIHGFLDSEKQKASLMEYIEKLTNDRSRSLGNYGNWKSMLKHLRIYAERDVSFAEVTKAFVQGFKDYLDDVAEKKDGNPLSQNTKHSYLNKFKAALKQAVADEIIIRNPGEHVKPFAEEESHREFLSLEELQSMIETECDNEILKTTFIFSCLTGLRWSDIYNLTWSQVEHSEAQGNYIRFRQKKTKGSETLPISETAFSLMGERQDVEDKVFKGMRYSSAWNEQLKQWAKAAGITKHVTFHVGRHTCATLLISEGEDIFTVQKILGHSTIKNTQVYAKIVDARKKAAVNKIKVKL
ncbi:MAG: site-specific integrase [Bacteroidia bacterium]